MRLMTKPLDPDLLLQKVERGGNPQERRWIKCPEPVKLVLPARRAAREAPADALRAVFTLVKLREYAAAGEVLKPVIEANLSAADQAALGRRFGTAQFMALARKAGEQNIAGARDFAQSVLEATATESAKPDVLNELVTNATKHGAWSGASGKVSVRSELSDRSLTVCWRETGAEAIQLPVQSGFGEKLSGMTIERQLGGSLNREWLPEGLCVTFTVGLDRL